MDKILTLKSGLRILIVPMPYLRSVAMGVAVGAGTITESEDERGLSHFIEHMLFKGTASRSAFDIAEEAESQGIQLNAYTTKKMTVYYAVSVSENIGKSADMLSDMFFNSTFEKDCLKKEKGVVCEEIAMYEDDPDDVCHEVITAAHFGGSILEYPILGTKSSVNSFSKSDILRYMNRVYTPDNTIICIAGGITDEEGIAIAEKYFESRFSPSVKRVEIVPDIKPNARYLHKFKPLEQVNAAFSFRSYPYGVNREAMSCLIDVMCGGMSGRLFQKVREEKGYVYSIYGDNTTFVNNGMFHIHFATNPLYLDDAVLTTREVILDAVKNGITEKEINKHKALCKAEFVTGLESSAGMMKVMLTTAMLDGKKFDIEERLKRIEALTVDEVEKAIKEVFDFNQMSAAYVGPKSDADIFRLMKEGK